MTPELKLEDINAFTSLLYTNDTVIPTLPQRPAMTGLEYFRVPRDQNGPPVAFIVDRRRMPSSDDPVLVFDGKQHLQTTYQYYLRAVDRNPVGFLFVGTICQIIIDCLT